MYAFDGSSFVRVPGYDATYQFVIDEDGSLQASRWREILPRVEVGFYDGSYGVLAESLAGESRKFGLDSNSMAVTMRQPTFNGIGNDEGNDVMFYRGVWRKLPNDSYDGPL